MAHPYDLLIQAHREGRYDIEVRRTYSYRTVDFYALHPVHQVPFISLISAEANSQDLVVRSLGHQNHLLWWAVLGAAMGNQTTLLSHLFKRSKDQFRKNLNWAVLGAAKGGHIPLINKLIEIGASPDFAVEGAAWGGHDVLMDKLLESGARRQSAICGAARGHHTALLEKLGVTPADYPTVIKGASSGGQNALVLEYLQKDMDVFDYWFSTMLKAASTHDFTTVETLLAGDVVIDRIHPKYGFPVVTLLASQPNCREAVMVLLQAGAQPRWAVMGAAMGHQDLLVDHLIDKGADINWAVEGAARVGHIELVNRLLKEGADSNCAVKGAAFGHQLALLDSLMIPSSPSDMSNTVKDVEESAILSCVKGAAEANHAKLVWTWLNHCAAHEVTLILAFNRALKSAALGGHRDLTNEIYTKMKESVRLFYNDQSCLILSRAVRGGHFAWAEELLRAKKLDNQFDINTLLKSAAISGSQAMVHRLLPMHEFVKEGESYHGVLRGGVTSGNLLFLDQFMARQDEIDDVNHEFPADTSKNNLLALASNKRQGASINRLFEAKADAEFVDECFLFDSVGEAACFLASIPNHQHRKTYVKSSYENAHNNNSKSNDRLELALPVANLMSRYGLNFKEANAWYRNRDLLKVILELQNKRVGELFPTLWQWIACKLLESDNFDLQVTNIRNILSAIQRMVDHARILCSSSTNFNGNALQVWLSGYAQQLKRSIWPAQQAKAVMFETLLQSANLENDSLDANWMLSGLERKNDQGQSIRSLLESLNDWEKLLNRFPAIAHQADLPGHQEKKRRMN